MAPMMPAAREYVAGRLAAAIGQPAFVTSTVAEITAYRHEHSWTGPRSTLGSFARDIATFGLPLELKVCVPSLR